MIKTNPSLMNNDFEKPPERIDFNTSFPVVGSLNKELIVVYGKFFKKFISNYIQKEGQPVKFGWEFSMCGVIEEKK